jgi:hypothetical protein
MDQSTSDHQSSQQTNASSNVVTLPQQHAETFQSGEGGDTCNTPPATYTGQQSPRPAASITTWQYSRNVGDADVAQAELPWLEEAPPATYEDGRIEVVAVGLDTLEINFYGGDYRPEVQQLVEAREEAAEHRASGGVEVEVGGVTLLVKGSGRRMYWGLAICSDFHLEFMREVPAKGSEQPPIRVKFLSSFLWREGWQKAAEMVVSWVGDYLLERRMGYRHQVSRVDLAVDSQGYAPSVDDVNERFIRRTGQPLLRAAPDGTTLESAYFGSRSAKGIFFRVYDKSKELKDNPGKNWFEDVWGAQGAYDPALTVWRTEVQLRRDALKTFLRRGEGEPTGEEPVILETVEDLAEALPSIWSYVTTRWLRLVEQGPDTNRWRAPLHPWWAALQGVDWGQVPVEVIRMSRAKAKYEQMLPQLAGTLETTLAAAIASGRFSEEQIPKDLKDLKSLFQWLAGSEAVNELQRRQVRRKQEPLDTFKRKLEALQPAMTDDEKAVA